ncbi:MAG: DUF4340 domain-containing protein [Pseudomonadota bacterium]
MKVKKEYLILGLVIVLLAAYLVFHDSNRSRFALPGTPKLDEKEISRIDIKTASESLSLTRKGTDWFIGEKNFPADPVKIPPMLTAIADLRLTALVSEAKVYERYDLSEGKKISVTAFAGEKELRRFDIGKVADTYQHTFVMLPNDSNVYHALKNFRRAFEEKADALRNMKVMAVMPENIKEIQLASAGKTVTLTRNEVPAPAAEEKPGGEKMAEPVHKADDAKTEKTPPAAKTLTVWLNAAGEKVDNETVKRLLAKFTSLACESYINDRKKEELADPGQTITLVADKPHTLSVFKKMESDNGYPAVSSENDYPFMLQAALFEEIKKEMEALMAQ